MIRTLFRTSPGVGAGGLCLALIAGFALTGDASAQTTGTLTGRVTDAASTRPLETVLVKVDDTPFGVLTNASGGYIILSVPPGEYTVRATRVGYREGEMTVTVTAGGTAELDFELEQTAIALDELVVTGAGIVTEKRKLGNTITTINTTSLENAPVSDFSQLIAGREPGVVALPSSGYTGEGARIRIRGSASLTQLNEPIVYVDGIRVDRSAVQNFNGQGNPSRLDDIPPESIERIEILKGAAAATLYGTEASNGVIQIFTKKGQVGAPRFTAQVDLTGISVPTNRILPMADFAGRVCRTPGCTGDGDAARLADAISRMSTRWGGSVQPFTPIERDLVPDLLTTGIGQAYSGSVSGGSQSFQYYVSGRLTTEDGPYDAARNFEAVPGIEPETDTNRRASITSNFTVMPSDKLRIGVTTLFSDMEHHTPDNSNNIYGVFSSALMMQLRLANDNNLYGQPAFATLRENMYQLNFVNSQHFTGTVNAEYTPIDDFRLSGAFGIDFTSDDAVSFRPYRWNVDGFSGSTPDGSRSVNEDRSREITADLKGSYIFRTDRIENTFLFGAQGFLRQRQSAGGGGRDFPGPGLETLSALGSEGSYESWLRVTQIGGYLQDQVGWDDWAFLTVGGRWDANSAFGSEFSTAFYPKVSLSMQPMRAMDMASETLSTFRLRSAIGQSGLQPGAFDKFTTFSSQGSEAGPGVRPANLGNESLRPEVSTEIEVGTEMGFLNDSWSMEATYWTRKRHRRHGGAPVPGHGRLHADPARQHRRDGGQRNRTEPARFRAPAGGPVGQHLRQHGVRASGDHGHGRRAATEDGRHLPPLPELPDRRLRAGRVLRRQARRQRSRGDSAEHHQPRGRRVRGADPPAGARVLQPAARPQQLQAARDRQQRLRRPRTGSSRRTTAAAACSTATWASRPPTSPAPSASTSPSPATSSSTRSSSTRSATRCRTCPACSAGPTASSAATPRAPPSCIPPWSTPRRRPRTG